MQQNDYIERLIRQVAEGIAAAFGFAGAGNPERAFQELEATWQSALGFRRADVERLDATSVRMILGGKIEAAVRLLEAEVSLHEARGDAIACEATRRLVARLRSP